LWDVEFFGQLEKGASHNRFTKNWPNKACTLPNNSSPLSYCHASSVVPTRCKVSLNACDILKFLHSKHRRVRVFHHAHSNHTRHKTHFYVILFCVSFDLASVILDTCTKVWDAWKWVPRRGMGGCAPPCTCEVEGSRPARRYEVFFAKSVTVAPLRTIYWKQNQHTRSGLSFHSCYKWMGCMNSCYMGHNLYM
jgi:hypothetical protein